MINYAELFDMIKEKLNIKEDQELAKLLDMTPQKLCLIRNGKNDLLTSNFFAMLKKLDNEIAGEAIKIFWRD